MAKIKMDIDALNQSAQAINTRIADLQALNTRLEELIGRIAASWEGNASAAYIATMRAHADKAKKMIDVLLEYKKYVDTAVTKFSDLDRNAASRIRGSF